MEFLLVHSPVVGPSTWRWVAESLSLLGHDVVVPDLRPSIEKGDPHDIIAAISSAAPSRWTRPSIVGHSGAGPFLPAVAAVRSCARSVFVDAGLPPRDGSATAGGDFLDRLRAMATDGRLPRWSTWWGEGAMERLVPDVVRRHELEAEMNEVPLRLYESPFDVPSEWWNAPCAYLLLSEAYRRDAHTSRALGWPVVERVGGHLDLVNDPGEIAELLIECAS